MHATGTDDELTHQQREQLMQIAAGGARPARPENASDLARLAACGLVSRDLDGRYRLTGKGRLRSVLWEGWPTHPTAGP